MKNLKPTAPVQKGNAATGASAQNKKFKAGAELRARILEAASRLFAEAGYANVSMRQIAQEVGCSTMAAYYHFQDKGALFEQLCVDLYDEFTRQWGPDEVLDPKEHLKKSMRDFVMISTKHPHHYRLTFLMPPLDAHAQELRIKITRPIIANLRDDIRRVLPPKATDTMVEERLHQLLAVTHGITAMLITHPRAYGLTLEKATQELESAFDRIIGC